MNKNKRYIGNSEELSKTLSTTFTPSSRSQSYFKSQIHLNILPYIYKPNNYIQLYVIGQIGVNRFCEKICVEPP